MVLGDFNFIEHPKDKGNGLSQVDKMVSTIWTPFLSEMDMVDPFREQNPNRKVWSFIGTGKAKNSRIDRLYVHSEDIPNIKNIRYSPTPFTGHRMLQFSKTGVTEHGKGYYKMNTSILKEPKHREL